MQLKWEAPEKDGGRPITHYVVEFKNKFLTDWTECAKTETADATCKVTGLKEKVVYQFRVRAVNKGGASKASEPSDNHTVKHKNCEYLWQGKHPVNLVDVSCQLCQQFCYQMVTRE